MTFALLAPLVLAASPAASPAPRPPSAAPAVASPARAVFAGGCFWCMEPPFDALPGVLATTSGYAGGADPDPTYEEVSSGRTGHAEAIEVEYDPARVTFDRLLEVFWRNVDPTTADRQFCDHGSQYRPAIFVRDEAQRRAAEESRARVERTKRFAEPVVVAVVPLERFHPAEAYHQDYYRKNPIHYRLYRKGCGRDARLRELWGEEGAGAH